MDHSTPLLITYSNGSQATVYVPRRHALKRLNHYRKQANVLLAQVGKAYQSR